MPEPFVPTLATTLESLLALRTQMRAARQTPDGTVHTPPSEAERVLEATGECLAALVERVAALELSHGSKPTAAALRARDKTLPDALCGHVPSCP